MYVYICMSVYQGELNEAVIDMANRIGDQSSISGRSCLACILR